MIHFHAATIIKTIEHDETAEKWKTKDNLGVTGPKCLGPGVYKMIRKKLFRLFAYIRHLGGEISFVHLYPKFFQRVFPVCLHFAACHMVPSVGFSSCAVKLSWALDCFRFRNFGLGMMNLHLIWY